ncbi:hypothetical protein Hdeb2414_s0017g00503451 [Helianthus debilis subsp. tardiflorus]
MLSNPRPTSLSSPSRFFLCLKPLQINRFTRDTIDKPLIHRFYSVCLQLDDTVCTNILFLDYLSFL